MSWQQGVKKASSAYEWHDVPCIPGEHAYTEEEFDDFCQAHGCGGEVEVWGDGPGVSQRHGVGSRHQGHHRQAVQLEEHAHGLWEGRQAREAGRHMTTMLIDCCLDHVHKVYGGLTSKLIIMNETLFKASEPPTTRHSLSFSTFLIANKYSLYTHIC